ncbi:DUF1963 domain-containing protein [Acinetobacter haemolyticus]|uniref:YwqG family protein n=1 Tax=Acinetobacter haemolyticus TaxID=29430 RepID=UPI0012985EF6|nr:YwqG family protein [Acinetobacter haemolyticus]MQZ30740.1 DUF1963 domain-containing protein [Acinetobacter haemolyticus]
MKLLPENLPSILHPYLEKISATMLPTVTMKLTLSDELTLWQSKIGGQPYLPLDVSYPTDDNGKRLALLAQFNFAEIPNLPNFPDKGILQFYIAADDLYGMNFDDQQQQSSFKVLFFDQIIEDVAQLKQDFSEVQFGEDDYLPFTGQYSIKFELASQPISVEDEGFNIGSDDDDFYDAYSNTFASTGHRLGGYPFFTQSDPRGYNKSIRDYILLFQLDTDDAKNDIMWGDSGVGNFFIHPEDLKKRDFSKVLYNWDCC